MILIRVHPRGFNCSGGLRSNLLGITGVSEALRGVFSTCSAVQRTWQTLIKAHRDVTPLMALNMRASITSSKSTTVGQICTRFEF